MTTNPNNPDALNLSVPSTTGRVVVASGSFAVPRGALPRAGSHDIAEGLVVPARRYEPRRHRIERAMPGSAIARRTDAGRVTTATATDREKDRYRSRNEK
jgi:hypothetical protein